MKKIILLLFGLFALSTAQAQDRTIFYCSSQEECITAVDSLLKNSKRTYEFVDFYDYKDRYYFNFKEANPTDPDNPMTLKVAFVKYMEGANPALEIEGTPVYKMNTIRGKFLDLFPIWKKYVDPNADAELLTTTYKAKTSFSFTEPKKQYFSFNYDNNDKSIWTIEIR